MNNQYYYCTILIGDVNIPTELAENGWYPCCGGQWTNYGLLYKWFNRKQKYKRAGHDDCFSWVLQGDDSPVQSQGSTFLWSLRFI